MTKRKTLKRLFYRIFHSPLLPLLFFQEGVKYTVAGEYELAAIHYGLFVLTSIIWAAMDSIEVEFDKESFIGD